MKMKYFIFIYLVVCKRIIWVDNLIGDDNNIGSEELPKKTMIGATMERSFEGYEKINLHAGVYIIPPLTFTHGSELCVEGVGDVNFIPVKNRSMFNLVDGIFFSKQIRLVLKEDCLLKL
jgi:hypothetical protein